MKGLVTTILDCSVSPNNWEAALNDFNDQFEISSSCMFSVHEFRDASVNFHWSDFFKKNITPEVLEMMQSGGDADDRPAYKFLFENPAHKFYSEPTMFGAKSWEDLPHSDVREVAKGYGFSMRTSSVLNKTGPWMDGLFCQHRSDAEWQSFFADSRTDLLFPIISNSLSLGRTLQALRSRFKASLAVLDALGLGVFLVDERGCVIEHNKEAQRVLDAADGFSVSENKRLKLHAPDKTAELETMISAANGLLHGEIDTAHSLMAAERPSGAYDYLISARALSDSQAELEAGLRCAFVTVIDPARSNALSVDGIATLGQLSDAESAVVDLLVQGFRPSDVAEQRDVSLNTVKTQLKVISQKLRCSTQSDIIRVAAATRVPIEKS